jgi:hypothetical protein
LNGSTSGSQRTFELESELDMTFDTNRTMDFGPGCVDVIETLNCGSAE